MSYNHEYCELLSFHLPAKWTWRNYINSQEVIKQLYFIKRSSVLRVISVKSKTWWGFKDRFLFYFLEHFCFLSHSQWNAFSTHPMTYCFPMRRATNTLDPSAGAPATLSNFRSYWCPWIEKFSHRCSGLSKVFLIKGGKQVVFCIVCKGFGAYLRVPGLLRNEMKFFSLKNTKREKVESSKKSPRALCTQHATKGWRRGGASPFSIFCKVKICFHKSG